MIVIVTMISGDQGQPLVRINTGNVLTIYYINTENSDLHTLNITTIHLGFSKDQLYQGDIYFVLRYQARWKFESFS